MLSAVLRTILIVDEDHRAAESLRLAIESHVGERANVVVATSANDALIALDGSSAGAIVVVDEHIRSDINALDLLRRVQQREPAHARFLLSRHPSVPVGPDEVVQQVFAKPRRPTSDQPLVRAIVERVRSGRG